MDWELPAADTYFRKIFGNTPRGFEIDHLEYALQYVTRWRLAVDVGAHVGTWTAYMATRFNKVIAFEPAPDTLECLEQNVKSYPNVMIIPAALGPFCGNCTVQDDSTRIGNTGARIIDLEPDGPVTMDTLDSYQIEALDFLKIDVEGFELRVLQGAANTLKHTNPVVVMECKKFAPPRHGGPEVAVAYLVSLGYKEVGGIRNDRVFTK